jgi:hypothetical protein
MAVAHLLVADRLAVVDQCDDIHATHTAPAFSPVREQLYAVGLPATFYEHLESVATKYRSALTMRDNTELDYEAEAGDVRALTVRGGKWVRTAHSAVRTLLADQHPEASKLATRLRLGNVSTDSNRVTRKAIDDMVHMFEKLPDLSIFHLPANFMDEGRALATSYPIETDETIDRRIERDMLSIEIEGLHKQVYMLLEQLVARKDMVEVITGEKLPGFDFALLRAAVAPRSSGTDPASEANETGDTGDNADEKPGL